MAYYTRTRIERVAEAINELRYTEVQSLATKLVDILTDRQEGEGHSPDYREMSDLLADWAQSVEDDIEARLREKIVQKAG